MDEDRISPFGGMAGRVLRETMSASTLLTGVVLGVFALIVGVVFTIAKMPSALNFFIQILMALALARFAMNGNAGEWTGSVLSTNGGSWFEAGAVMVRYLVLMALWLAPLTIFGLKPLMDPQNMSLLMGPAGGRLVGLMLLYMVGMALTPPLFLVVAVRARGITDIFSVQHWKSTFRGRVFDLYALYAMYAGGCVVALCLSILPVMLVGLVNPKLALGVGALVATFLFGFSVTLLGRLCGFFVLGEVGEETETVSEAQPDGDPGAPSTDDGKTTTSSHPGKNVLMDASGHLKQAWTRFEQDKPGAIEMLESLGRSCTPNAQVRHALCLMYWQSGDRAKALKLAQVTLPMCLERGQVSLAADIYGPMQAELRQLELEPDQSLALAGALREKQDWKNAANIYARLIQKERQHRRAIKGMLQVAEILLRQEDKPKEAFRVYGFLLQHCADSPLVDFMREGHAEAERRMSELTPA